MFSFFRLRSKRQQTQKTPAKRSCFEVLEDRSVLSAFAVVNLNDHGAGSFRQAIIAANNSPGADVINFNVAGTIKITTSALPAITGEVDIDGTTAPGFDGTPVVAINHNGKTGLKFNASAAGSSLESLALISANGAGITINGGGEISVIGNYIGLGLDGTTASGNSTYGIDVINSSGNSIGGISPLQTNVISGNKKDGIRLSNSSDNQILGNYIGTDETGTVDVGNVASGILVTSGSDNNLIEVNLISGNNGNGIFINLNSTQNTVSNNTIGLVVTQDAALGNNLDGIKIENASDNLIGQTDLVGVNYYSADGITLFNASDATFQPVTDWQGIRGADIDAVYFIAGVSGGNGLLYEGTLDGTGLSYPVNYPNAVNTEVYGPDNLDGDGVRLVGTYTNSDSATADVTVHGFLFEGTKSELNRPSHYRTIDYPGAAYNFARSTMGGLVVGNYDSLADHGASGLTFGPGHAYIYDIAQDSFLTDVVYPGSASNTAYGIWYNGGTSYTICGGYSLDPVNNFEDQANPLGSAYLVDYDSSTGLFTNWKSFDYPNGTDFLTQFTGISSVEPGVYTLSANSVESGTSNSAQGSWVMVNRNTDGSFDDGFWVDLNYTGIDPTTNITSANSVFGNQVVGIAIGDAGFIPYQATVHIGFFPSNVISGNSGNGIGLYGASNNQIAMNNIGTDDTGTVALGNGSNGILVSAASTGNLIGGEMTDGNDPMNGEFVQPPQGNIISGNSVNGVLITGKSTQNQLSGNLIGTDATGIYSLGNSQDGVAIANANNNSLIGGTASQNPFVFYNVVSGNGGNGLRVTSSNDTIVQGNFFGIGADDDTPAGNLLNGILVEGTSAHTTIGGPPPLVNVVAANGQNGIVVRNTASYATSHSNFIGLAAFSDNPTLGNGLDGILVTSTGGNVLIRENVIAENSDDGIEISGPARDVRVVENYIGLNSDGTLGMGNFDNGVEVGGTVHDIFIGGPQTTSDVLSQNIISDNGDNGVAIIGTAHNITVSHSYIGTDVLGTGAIGNAEAGVYLGKGTYSNTIGSTDSSLLTVISGNVGNGIEMDQTRGNTVIGTYIGTDVTGALELGNGENGVLITNSFSNVIGNTTSNPANIIAFNDANGVFVQSGNGNGIRQNSIHDNGLLGIDLGTGANQNQAAPVLTSVQTLSSTIQVTGTLTSKANNSYSIEFFASAASGPSGRFFLGSQTISTNASGEASFTFIGSAPPTGANFITATATDLNVGSLPSTSAQLLSLVSGLPSGLRRFTASAGATGTNTSEFSNSIS